MYTNWDVPEALRGTGHFGTGTKSHMPQMPSTSAIRNGCQSKSGEHVFFHLEAAFENSGAGVLSMVIHMNHLVS